MSWLPCCATYWDVVEGVWTEFHCTGVMELCSDDAEYVCDTCFGRCGYWAHAWEVAT